MQVAPDHAVEAEHVADNVVAGGDELAAVWVELEDDDSSSDAGYQAINDGDTRW
jgi:hypothetical protein